MQFHQLNFLFGQEFPGRGQQRVQTQNLFTSAELELLLEREYRFPKIESRNKLIVSFLIYQGLTRNEIRRMEVGDIDLKAGTIYVKASNKLSRRVLELRFSQYAMLSEFINNERPKLLRDDTNTLFVGRLGEQPTVDTVTLLLNPFKLLFPDRILNAQTVRQSVIANWLNEKKIPLEDVQLMSGQKSPSTTEKYRSIDSEEQRKLINQYHPLR